MKENIKLVRGLLLVFGCLPMIALHGVLSFGVLLFALPAMLLGGNPMNIIFVAWWLFGTYALMALVYSCATYRSESGGLKLWQQIGLIAGVLLTVPIILQGFTHGLGVLAALLGSTAGIIVLLTERRRDDSKFEE
jgi:hypothetical protein